MPDFRIGGISSRLNNVSEKNGELWASCPMGIHSDRTPSFSINLREGIFYCFSCQSSGTVNQLAAKMRILPEGRYQPSPKRKSFKQERIRPWRRAQIICQSFDLLEDWIKKTFRKSRNKIEEDWNEGRISEAEYYFKRQLLNYEFDCYMGIHDENRNRLNYEAKLGVDSE